MAEMMDLRRASIKQLKALHSDLLFHENDKDISKETKIEVVRRIAKVEDELDRRHCASEW